ncbi:MAG: SDR family NAD(P)-dependent oxidoreductase [Phycisphaerales bacterium JB037]
MSRIRLQGRPIVITGASSGIGAATAVACAQAGMPVVLGARRVDRLESLAERIRGAGGRAVVRACDVSSEDDCRSLVDACRTEFGSIYAVYANAGYGFRGAVLETTDQQLRDILDVNAFGSLRVLRAAAPHLLEAGAGHLIMCSSCLSKVGVPRVSAYTCSKAMQDHLGRALRHELKNTGVHVSTVHPIGTKTEFFDELEKRTAGDPDAKDTTRDGPFMQTPERVARAIVRCLEKPRGEIWTSRSFRTLLGLGVIFPGFADWMVARYERRSASRNGSIKP